LPTRAKATTSRRSAPTSWTPSAPTSARVPEPHRRDHPVPPPRSRPDGGIVRIQLARFEKLLADRRLTLALDDSAAAWLADKGYDPVYGARPLKRVIQKDLVDPIARKLLAGEIEDGSVIAVSTGGRGWRSGRRGCIRASQFPSTPFVRRFEEASPVFAFDRSLQIEGWLRDQPG
jgi:hypothetical protein